MDTQQKQMTKIVSITREMIDLSERAIRLPDCKAKRELIKRIEMARNTRNELRATIK